MIKRSDPQSNAPVMMLSAGNGFIMQSDKYSRDNAGQSLKKYILLKKGELAYNHGASKAKQFGCCYELQEEEARIPYVYHCFKVCDTEYTPCNGVQREHNKKLNNGLPILHKVPPKRDYGRYFCIMAEKGGTSHGGLTEKLSPFFHAKKQEVNAYGR